jgi:hypothetical protein
MFFAFVVGNPTVAFKLIRRLENDKAGFYSVSGVSREGGVVGFEGYMGLHDGWTEPVFFKNGRRSKSRPKTTNCRFIPESRF